MISYSGGTLYPPDGYRSGAGNPSLLTHAEADAFGLADVRAPGGALMGVFLDATVPAEGDALPTMLQYATPEQRNQLGQSPRSEEHTSELQSLMRMSSAVFCLKNKRSIHHTTFKSI